MKYTIRAVKYFFYYIFLLILVLGILVLANFVEADITSIFRNGYTSLWQIAVMFACVAAVYPLFGFMKRDLVIPGEYGNIRDGIVEYMEEKGYRLETEEGEDLKFRLRSPAMKLTRMFEDRITMTRQLSGFSVEGLRKDVVRLVYGLENKMRSL